MSPDGAIARAEAHGILTIDLTALAGNWRKLDAMVAPAECAAVVKADAYGIGIEAAVPALARAGCRTFFVAHISEGRRVRSALGGQKSCPIFVLNGLLPDATQGDALREANLLPVIGSQAEFAMLRAANRRGGARIKPAIHIDTGMNRLGLRAADAIAIASLGSRTDLEPVLIMSHLIASEEPSNPLNGQQIAAFDKIRAMFPRCPASLANSSGIFLGERPFYDLVRPGYALYGGNPTPGRPNPMRPVVKLDAPIIQINTIEAGETVGYNALWRAPHRCRLATIGIGYGDGYPRAASGNNTREGGAVVIAGRRCPIVGRISMDLTVVDVSEVQEGRLSPGVMAEILGEAMTIHDVAASAGTIGYEILTSLGRRYHRIYERE